jgi:hypothetical protein
MSPRIAVCFLVINRMEVLPEISITSAYDRTHAEILLGYLDENDLPALRPDVVVQPLLLENSLSLGLANLTGGYSDFSQDEFYRIVQLKWQLLEKALQLGYDYVIYSDTDVYWNTNPIPEIINVFDNREQVHIQIQSFTDFPSQPKLCMGFVAIRNSPKSSEVLADCKMRHSIHAREYGRIGDDDIVTQYFIDNNCPSSILELPQTTFPVGRMLKLYANQSKFPGLPSPKPYIFHANYVVGLRNKIILMKVFIRNYANNDEAINLSPQQYFILQAQRIRLRLRLGRVRSRLLNRLSN